MARDGRAGLPADVTSLVGRRAEIVEVRRLLDSSRLVTLTGVGGVGKTRLALAAARDLGRRFADGIRLVELDGLVEPDLLVLTVIQELGVPRPDSAGIDDLVELIGAGRLLLVLDNCEHLVAEVGTLVARVLRACPGVQVLATSREPLGIAGESVFVVPPLAAVRADGSRGDAVALFTQRATAVVPGFAVTAGDADTVAEICRRLDGLPLAIELAAVLLRTFSLRELLERQDRRFELLTRGNRGAAARHQTLRGAIDWSYDLCSEPERLLWARLSVFRGSFRIGLVEQVCGGPEFAGRDIGDVFAGLVDKSIVSRESDSAGAAPGRHRLLETIRAFGRERLTAAGRLDEFEERYSQAYLRLAEDADAAWFGPDQAEWSSLLRAEHHNFRAVLDSGLAHPGLRVIGLRTAVALSSYWLACGYQREGRLWLDRYLADGSATGSCPDQGGGAHADPGGAPGDTALRARALCVAAHLAALAGDGRAALAHAAEVLRCADADQAARAHAEYLTGLARIGADPGRAATALERGVELERGVPGDSPHLPLALVNLALARCINGETEAALPPLEESREICQARGDRWVLAWTLMIRGVAEWLRGEPAAATALLRTALRHKHDLGDVLGVALATEFLAWAAESTGEAERAARLFGASRMLFRSLGAYLVAIGLFLRWHDSAERRVKAALGDVRYERSEQWGRSLGMETAVAYALGEPAPAVRAATTGAPGAAGGEVLSKRELQVAELLTEGLSSREIAARLTIAPRTADSHVEHIRTKLGFTSRAQITAWLVARRENSVPR
ncbi:MAG TPA: LuxR C-terminal-related transcriptional regulator [Pseudonocardia sp.]|nr:LuxR C-terminal-related transcriptional regulator [Pseudonocardia sp.]